MSYDNAPIGDASEGSVRGGGAVALAAGNAGNGRLSLGDVAVSGPVSVQLVDGALEITPEPAAGVPLGPHANTRRLWALGDLASSVPLTHRSVDALLTAKSEPGASLFLADKTLVADLLAVVPRIGAVHQRWRWAWPGLAAGAAVAGIGATLWSLDVSPASAIARQMPGGLRTRFGTSVLNSLTGDVKTCAAPAGEIALKALTDKLTASVPEAKTFKIAVVDWPVVNAFTAPGGQIVVARGLIAEAQGPDEVAGVIAHELGHAIERHPEAAIIRVLGLSAAAELVLGGSSATAGNVGLIFAQLSYTRDAEREADAHAFRLLKAAGISPKGIAVFFRRMAAEHGESKAGAGKFAVDILSTHPASMDRAALADAQGDYPVQPALDDAQWAALQAICGEKPVVPIPQNNPDVAKVTPPKPGAPSGTGVSDANDNDARTIAGATATLALSPNNEPALRARARANIHKRNYAAASADLDTLLRLKFEDDQVLRMHGAARLALADPTSALQDFSAVLARNPRDGFATAERGRSYLALKRYDEAIADFKAAIGLRKEVVDHNNLGLALAGKRDFTGAIAEYTIAIKADPHYVGALVNRGWASEQSGDRATAIADYTAAAAMALPPPDRYPQAAKSQEYARARVKSLTAVPSPAPQPR